MTQAAWIQELQANKRLRLGMWMILAILLSYAVLWLGDYRQQLIQDYQAAFTRLTQLETIAEQTEWLERAEAAKQLRKQAEKRLWQTQNIGLARAELQNWLEQQMQAVGVAEARTKIKIEEVREIQQPFPVWRLSAHLTNIPFEIERLNDLVLAIVQHPQMVLIDRLEVRDNQRHLFSIVVTAYFQPVTS